VFKGNEYTCFGTAVHEACEGILKQDGKDPYAVFDSVFADGLTTSSIPEDTPLAIEMKKQVIGLFELILPTLDDYFEDKGGWTLEGAEESLMEAIPDSRVEGYNFKGFIDVILKDGNGHYHIIDWKTCSWGWDARKKNNTLYVRQLVLYKHYYAKKHGLAPRTISTHFGLIKRTVKKDRVEIFRVTSGERKTKNSLDFLSKALYNIKRGRRIKNRLSCKYCPYYETEHCT